MTKYFFLALYSPFPCHMPHSQVSALFYVLVIFVVMLDQEEIGTIVALEIGVQLGIKGESERFVVFTRMN